MKECKEGKKNKNICAGYTINKLDNKEANQFLEMQNRISEAIVNSMNIKLEEHIIEGLRRKGFVFEDRKTLIEFISKRCSSKQTICVNETIYLVDEIPFFVHSYKTEVDFTKSTEKIGVLVSYGSFNYI